MQKLNLSFLESLPDFESLSLFLTSMPTRTLHIFSSSLELSPTNDFFNESFLIEENYHILKSFFISFIQKTNTIIERKNEENCFIFNELECLRHSLQRNDKIAQDFNECYQKQNERYHIVASRNQELENITENLASKISENHIKDYKNLQKNNKSKNFIEENENFLEEENKANFLQKNGKFCNCQEKNKKEQEESEKIKMKNKKLLEENEILKENNVNLQRKIDLLCKEIRKYQLELQGLKDKKFVYEVFKYDFLTNSKKPTHELEIKSACKAKRNFSSDLKRRVKKKGKKHTHRKEISRDFSCDTLTLLGDIERTMRRKTLDSTDMRENELQITDFSMDKIEVKIKKKLEKKNIGFIEIWVYYAMFWIGILKKIADKNRIFYKIFLGGMKIAMIMMVLYWINCFKIVMFFGEIPLKVWNNNGGFFNRRISDVIADNFVLNKKKKYQ